MSHDLKKMFGGQTVSQEDPIEIVIIDEKDSPFKKQPARNFKGRVVGLVGRALAQTAKGAWFVSKKVWQSEARKKTTDALGKQANKAWQSEARKNLTRKAGQQVGKVVERNKETIQNAVTQAVNQRLDKEKERITKTAQETDWKDVAKKGTSTGIKKFSQMLGRMANKINEQEQKK